MVEQLSKHYPKLKFAPAEQFVWSPSSSTIFYNQAQTANAQGVLALLHEVGHALLGHHTYNLDIDLLNMEVEAWVKARELATRYNVTISEDHIESCLETYRTWLFKRSRCPNCNQTSLQQDVRTYRCFICRSQWRVAPTRSLSPRRMQCVSFG